MQYYFINPCHNTTVCNSGTILGAVCQKDGAAKYHGCGTLSSGTWSETGNGGGFQISYTGGENGRASIIFYKCDKSTASGTFYQNPTDSGTKIYSVYFSSKYACPLGSSTSGASTNDDSSGGGGGGLSGGSVFMILVLVFVVVYFVGGFVFLKYYKKMKEEKILFFTTAFGPISPV